MSVRDGRDGLGDACDRRLGWRQRANLVAALVEELNTKMPSGQGGVGWARQGVLAKSNMPLRNRSTAMTRREKDQSELTSDHAERPYNVHAHRPMTEDEYQVELNKEDAYRNTKFCASCGGTLRTGDLVLKDRDTGCYVHEQCCYLYFSSYCKADGTPIGPDDGAPLDPDDPIPGCFPYESPPAGVTQWGFGPEPDRPVGTSDPAPLMPPGPSGIGAWPDP